VWLSQPGPHSSARRAREWHVLPGIPKAWLDDGYSVPGLRSPLTDAVGRRTSGTARGRFGVERSGRTPPTVRQGRTITLSVTAAVATVAVAALPLVLLASATVCEEPERSEDAGRKRLAESRSQKSLVDSVTVSGNAARRWSTRSTKPGAATGRPVGRRGLVPGDPYYPRAGRRNAGDLLTRAHPSDRRTPVRIAAVRSARSAPQPLPGLYASGYE
jgi:hypothetical protein